MRLLQPRHPNRLGAQHPRIVEDLLEMADAGQQDALDATITMLEDLTLHSLGSRYAQPLKGTPIWELKTRSRGGQKGGARVYWFPLQLTEQDEVEVLAVIVNAETKTGQAANRFKLSEALEMHFAFKHDVLTMLKGAK